MLTLITVVSCVALDVVSALTLMFNVKFFPQIISVIILASTFSLGIFFIYATQKFLATAVGKLSSKAGVSNGESLAKMKKMAKFLRLAAFGLFLYCLIVVIQGISGVMIAGLFTPYGWCLVWGSYVPVRFLTSQAKIMMAKSNEKKSRVKPLNQNSTNAASSVGSAAVSSAAVSSSIGGNSSTGSSSATSASSPSSGSSS